MNRLDDDTDVIQTLLKPRIAAILAFLAYGTWAAICNLSYGLSSAAQAFAVQGSYALLSTLLLGTLACALLSFFGKSALAALLSFAGCLLFMVLIPWALHSLAGTPEILLSMIPGLIWGSLYLTVLLWSEYQKHVGTII